MNRRHTLPLDRDAAIGIPCATLTIWAMAAIVLDPAGTSARVMDFLAPLGGFLVGVVS